MENSVKWGIIGLGNIASKFAEDLLLVKDAELYAVASRQLEKASLFASQFGAKAFYGSYEELFNDPEVQIVYIATPHDSHARLSIEAMQAGKHVLCEKPIALNSDQAKAMIATSKKENRFLMEAFWSRFNPSICEVIQKVQEGDIGMVKYLQADFTFRVEEETGSRMFDMQRGGGSLLDMGVYPVFLSYVLCGVPQTISAKAKKYKTGADYQTAMIFEYQDSISMLYSGFASQSNMIATVSGEKGRFVLNPIWHETHSYSYFENNTNTETLFRRPLHGNGFSYEIEECHSCLLEGVVESKKWSHINSLELISIVDEIRSLIDLTYPSEEV